MVIVWCDFQIVLIVCIVGRRVCDNFDGVCCLNLLFGFVRFLWNWRLVCLGLVLKTVVYLFGFVCLV